jgi:polysaccharide deacetylase family protein (PEP-CTERM system associated)
MNKCILTIDLEDWYHGKYPGYDYRDYKFTVHRVVEPTLKLVELLEKCGCGATFFVLGETARDFPELVVELDRKGFEIASHGFEHRLAWEMGKEQWSTDLQKSIETLEKLTGKKPAGYRAPNFSLDAKRTPWAFEILEREGFIYDSSIFPAKMYYGGSPNSIRFIHKIGSLWEFPPSVMKLLWLRLAFGGGFYFRVFPNTIIELGIKNFLSKNEIPILYLHPKDVDHQNPLLPVNRLKNWIHSTGTVKALKKSESILNKYSSNSILKSIG